MFTSTPLLNAFATRHIGVSQHDLTAMLAHLHAPSLAHLMESVVPQSIRRTDTPTLGTGMTEPAMLERLAGIAKKNTLKKSLIGQGYYGTHTPAVILRNLLENPAWYTAYTPYQPEISQGRLELLMNFQTVVTDLTGLPIANASLLDEATAAAEAMALAKRSAKNKSNVFFIEQGVHPQTIAVIQTRAAPLGIEVMIGSIEQASAQPIFAILLQYPTTNGEITDYAELTQALHTQQTLVVVATDLLALTLLKAPGEWGADMAIGSSQRFGVPMMGGGPHAGFMAVRDELKRAMPGRLIGVSIDKHGQTAYRLTLATREQHIRREKATSNICTAQALLAMMAGLYATWHGAAGLSEIATQVHQQTARLALALTNAGFKCNSHFFDTLCISGSISAATLMQKATDAGFNLRYFAENTVVLSLDETITEADLSAIAHIFGAQLPEQATLAIPAHLQRQSAFLTHPVFNRYHSETEMMRYLRWLSDKDIALDRAMIPLGSCTMKLNAASEMLAVTWPEFATMHPFAPVEQLQGNHQLAQELMDALCTLTGYDACSLQPNSGASGEYAGLLAIRAFHASRGESHRNVCLIPASAHGTNPASAQMAGLKVVVTACDERGNVDLADLTAKAEQYSAVLAATMITYPSTHGVFETHVRQVCEVIHRYGGQVYLDGANMNAMVGLSAPGLFGSDVSHLNLHKTFAIPHGGGGPGIGPIVVKAHLAPFLPGSTMVPAVSAAPFGSIGVAMISWAYIMLMGRDGLTNATRYAILSANYLADALSEDYTLLYAGENNRVAHECILDIRPLEKETGISAEDIAKRLIDYGFHAPTMSFPVPGTLMIEPTESESKAELDRFITAMRCIRAEIAKVASGEYDPEDNPLKHAPHTAVSVCSDQWTHSYSREVAAYPVKSLTVRKYWPPVGRVDNAYGDRNLLCSCPPLSDYA